MAILTISLICILLFLSGLYGILYGAFDKTCSSSVIALGVFALIYAAIFSISCFVGTDSIYENLRNGGIYHFVVNNAVWFLCVCIAGFFMECQGDQDLADARSYTATRRIMEYFDEDGDSVEVSASDKKRSGIMHRVFGILFPSIVLAIFVIAEMTA